MFYQLFQNAFSAKHLCAASTLCSLTRPQPEKTFPSTLVISHVFETNTQLLANSCLWRSYTDSQLWLVDLFLTGQVMPPKCCWVLEAVVQLSSVKMKFCKTSQISQKPSEMEFLFCKIVSPQGCNCTKKDSITGIFL